MDHLKKVNIFLIGSRKSGTTSLASYLGSHRDISLSSIKESNYWDKKSIERVDSISEYHQLFDWSVDNQLDASTSYTTYPFCSKDLPEKIYNYNPEAKLIYLVRNPIERIKSHYKMSFERGDLKGSLNEALLNHPLLISCGKYYFQIQRFLKFFSKEQVLVLSIDELNTKDLAEKVSNFLELKSDFDFIMNKENAANDSLRMPRKMDGFLNGKWFSGIRKWIPRNIVRYIKGLVFRTLNREIDVSLNKESIALLESELLDDLLALQDYVSFDIDQWKIMR